MYSPSARALSQHKDDKENLRQLKAARARALERGETPESLLKSQKKQDSPEVKAKEPRKAEEERRSLENLLRDAKKAGLEDLAADIELRLADLAQPQQRVMERRARLDDRVGVRARPVAEQLDEGARLQQQEEKGRLENVREGERR